MESRLFQQLDNYLNNTPLKVLVEDRIEILCKTGNLEKGTQRYNKYKTNYIITMSRLSTHNSLSYLKPIHWYHNPLKPWHQCQDLTLQEQYDYNVRLFDVRVKLINNTWHYVHNMVDYGTMEEHSEVNEFFETHPDAKIRLCLDMRDKDKFTEEYKNKFLDLCRNLMYNHSWNIDRIIDFATWNEYKTPTINYTEYHVSVSGKWYNYIFGTKLFAKLKNEKYISNQTDTEMYYMIDYVQFTNLEL